MPSPKPLLCLPLFLLLTACGPGKSPITTGKTDTNLFSVKADDSEMNAAIARARFNLPRFDSALASDNYDPGWNMLKVRFPTPRGGYEHIWLAGITSVNGGYKGIVTDTVYETTKVKKGDTVSIKSEDITDWMVGTDSLIHGAYTTRIILKRMTSGQRAQYDRHVKYRLEE
jgi:uncharacterized protein YegJ (DUF2314 family)